MLKRYLSPILESLNKRIVEPIFPFLEGTILKCHIHHRISHDLICVVKMAAGFGFELYENISHL